MKIMYISGFDISASNGPGVNEYETIKEMIRVLGNNAFFIIPKPAREIAFVEEHANQFAFTRVVDKDDYFRIFKNQKEIIKKFKSALFCFQPDMLLFRPIFCPYALNKCAKISSIPYAIKTLGVGVYNPSKKKKGIKGIIISVLQKINESMMKRLVNGAIAIDVVTSEYKKYFGEKYPSVKDRIFLIENAVNTDMFKPIDKSFVRNELGLESFEPIIGFTGGSPYVRGGKLMMEAADKLVHQFPKIGIVIVGPKDKKLTSAFSASSQKEHIVLTDKVPYEKVPLYINSFDVCVSCDDSNIISNFGNSSQKVRQYLACGKPVLSGGGQDTAFIKDLDFGDIVLDVNDVNEFYEIASRLLSMSKQKKDDVANRATSYALEKLSVRGAFAQRMRIWESNLAK